MQNAAFGPLQRLISVTERVKINRNAVHAENTRSAAFFSTLNALLNDSSLLFGIPQEIVQRLIHPYRLVAEKFLGSWIRPTTADTLR